MKILTSVLFALMVGLFSCSNALAGTLRDFIIERSSPYAGEPTDLIVEYTTEGSVGSTGFIFRMFIDGAFSAPTAHTDTNMHGRGMTLELNGVPFTGEIHVATIRNYGSVYMFEVRVFGEIPANTRVKVKIDRSLLSNTHTPGSYKFYVADTARAGGAEIDVPDHDIILNTIAPPAIPSLTEGALMIFGSLLAAAAALTLHRRRKVTVA